MATMMDDFLELPKTHTQIDGKWVLSRPLSGPFWCRLKDAWLVLVGKADAFMFYKQ